MPGEGGTGGVTGTDRQHWLLAEGWWVCCLWAGMCRVARRACAQVELAAAALEDDGGAFHTAPKMRLALQCVYISTTSRCRQRESCVCSLVQDATGWCAKLRCLRCAGVCSVVCCNLKAVCAGYVWPQAVFGRLGRYVCCSPSSPGLLWWLLHLMLDVACSFQSWVLFHPHDPAGHLCLQTLFTAQKPGESAAMLLAGLDLFVQGWREGGRVVGMAGRRIVAVVLLGSGARDDMLLARGC